MFPKKMLLSTAYASIRIRGEILDYLRKSSNLDRTTIIIKKNSEKAINHLRNKLGREPYRNEIANELGMSSEKYLEWSHAFEASVSKSLEDSYDDYSNWFVTNDLNPEEQINDIELRESLKKALKKLEGKEALINTIIFCRRIKYI